MQIIKNILEAINTIAPETFRIIYKFQHRNN